jgi:hypothetical protein
LTAIATVSDTGEHPGNRVFLLFGAGLIGLMVGVAGTTYVGAQGTPQITRTELLRKPMSGMDGKEIVVFLADIPPGGVELGNTFTPAMRRFTCCKGLWYSSRNMSNRSS